MRLPDALFDLLFPPKCPFCGAIMDAPAVCPACRKVLPWTTDADGVRILRGGIPCAAPLRYHGLAREGLLRFKFHGSLGAAAPLGALLASCAAERFSGEFDTVTWTPVSRKRLRKRGFDQARLLAESACRHWDAKPEALLEKVRDNLPQSGFSDAAERRANVLGAYRILPGTRVSGRRILLVDDICTTGATLAECVRVLEDGGAAKVVCAAAALSAEGKSGKPEKNRVAITGAKSYNDCI